LLSVKAFAITSVIALILLLIGIDLALQRKKQRLDEEREKAVQEEKILSSKPPPDPGVHDFLKRLHP